MAFEYPLTFFYTRDLAQTARFYEDVLGLPLVRDQGTCRIYRVGESGYVGFCERESAPKQPQGVILTFVTEDVDSWHQRLHAAGVVFEKPPTDNPTYGLYHCFFRDPNGYLLEIQRFYEPLA
ncbi:MAG: VOC family protein [Chloroflexi bacterium]|nr:VOC family protein [Chloroflexota bacterium]